MTSGSDPGPERDIYQAPEAALELNSRSAQPFYVVSRTKFIVLFLTTLGFYRVYWFYRHWKSYRHFVGRDLWPIPRAVFSIIFAPSLFERIYRESMLIDAGLDWRYGMDAGLYIVFFVVYHLSDNLPSWGSM